VFKETPKEPRWLDKEEAVRLLEECIYALVATVRNTGMRRAELFHLKWSDIDFRNRIIIVRSREDRHTKKLRVPDYPYERLPLRSSPKASQTHPQ